MHLYELNVNDFIAIKIKLIIYFIVCINMDYMFMNLIKFKMFIYLFYVTHLYELDVL